MWRFKGCPRCNGDVFLERDIGGWYERCLQCGHNQDLESVIEVKEQASGRDKELALAGSQKTTAE